MMVFSLDSHSGGLKLHVKLAFTATITSKYAVKGLQLVVVTQFNF